MWPLFNGVVFDPSDRSGRAKRVSLFRDLDEDDYDDLDLQSVPRKQIDSLVKKLREGTAKELELDQFRGFKIGMYGEDFARVLLKNTDYSLTKSLHAFTVSLYLTSYSFSQVFYKQMMDRELPSLAFSTTPSDVDELLKTHGTLQAYVLKRQYVLGYVIMLWKVGIIATNNELKQLARTLEREVGIHYEQFNRFASRVEEQMSVFQSKANPDKRVTSDGLRHTFSMHPIIVHFPLVAWFVRAILTDGLGLRVMDGNLRVSEYPPLLVTEEERGAFIYRLCACFANKGTNIESLVSGIPNVVDNEAVLGDFSKALLRMIEMLKNLTWKEGKISIALANELRAKLEDDRIGRLKDLHSLVDYLRAHVKLSMDKFQELVNDLGIHLDLELETTAPVGASPLSETFRFLPNMEQRYFVLIHMDKSQEPAHLYDNSLSGELSSRPYPIDLMVSYKKRTKHLVKSIPTIIEKASSRTDFWNVLKAIYASSFSSQSVDYSTMLTDFLISPCKHIILTADEAIPLLYDISSPLEADLVALLFSKLAMKQEAPNKCLNSVFYQCFRRALYTPVHSYYALVRVYAQLCVNHYINLPTSTEREKPPHSPILSEFDLIISGFQSKSRDAMNTFLPMFHMLTELLRFHLIPLTTIFSTLEPVVSRIVESGTSLSSNISLIQFIYHILGDNFLFFVGANSDTLVLIDKIHAKLQKLAEGARLINAESYTVYATMLPQRYTHPREQYLRAISKEKDDPDVAYERYLNEYKRASAGLFNHSLPYHWFKQALRKFCMQLRSTVFIRLHVLSGTSSQYLEDLCLSATDDVEETLEDLRDSLEDYQKDQDNAALCEAFIATTISRLDFSAPMGEHFVPDEFYEGIFAHLEDIFQLQGVEETLRRPKSDYRSLIRLPASTPEELASVFLADDVLSGEMLLPIRCLLTAMSHSTDPNIHSGFLHVLRLIHQNIVKTVATGNAQASAMAVQLLGKLIEPGVIDVHTLSRLLDALLFQDVRYRAEKGTNMIHLTIPPLSSGLNGMQSRDEQTQEAFQYRYDLVRKKVTGYPSIKEGQNRLVDMGRIAICVYFISELLTQLYLAILANMASTSVPGVRLLSPMSSALILRELGRLSWYLNTRKYALSTHLADRLTTMSREAELLKNLAKVLTCDARITELVTSIHTLLMPTIVDDSVDKEALDKVCKLLLIVHS
ncbi:hypothetical protein GMRT_12686 [Giardia muris]|uniref:Uncharacterized protein n=1 Tax=Giardia muris TaxID=5742 RepID=A0A4Z1TD66_GIAMU|nr:hypothetical protein GMRT_12686 [Giardia muris]|eukprot:TNJ30479.1 hypothetical protein GMRT_12686 [Giardia muris]